MADLRRLRLSVLLASACSLSLGATPGLGDLSGRDAAFANARAALERGDGVAAEIALREAQKQGADSLSLAAGLGEAYLAEGKLDKAREWLGPAKFAAADRSRGFRMLARLEGLQGNDAQAAAALNRAIESKADDAEAWVDVAQLRYRTGNQIAAYEALRSALRYGPENLRAIDFMGLIVRDQFGPEASLQWFERGLQLAPNDGVLLADYAATLGHLGRYRQMLVVTRRMLELGVSEANAHYLQAVMAARAGNLSLARACLNRAGKAVEDMPAAILLSGIVDLQGGNPKLAEDAFRRILAAQPQNESARLLLARAMYERGDQRGVIAQFSSWAASPSAPAYLLTLVARSYEDTGRRDMAAPLLDRAASVQDAALRPAFDFGGAPGNPADAAAAQVRSALWNERPDAAVAISLRLKSAWPGMGSASLLVGDAQFAAARFDLAAQAYSEAARVRFDDNLVVRMVLTSIRNGQAAGGARLAASYVNAVPQSPIAARLAADYAASIGDWNRVRALLENLKQRGSSRDIRLLSDLSYAQLRLGDATAAAATARRAIELQPASPVAAQALAMALKAGKGDEQVIKALATRAARP